MSATCLNIAQNFPTDCPKLGNLHPKSFIAEVKSVFLLGVQAVVVLRDKNQTQMTLRQHPPEWLKRGVIIQIDFDRFGKSQISLVENATND